MKAAAIIGALALSLVGTSAAEGADAAPPEASVPSVPSVPSARLTLAELMHRMSTTPGVVARFHEQKHLSLLEDPIASRGRLHFVPPDCMVWRTTSPGESTLVIEGERVRFRDEASLQDVDLSGNTVARHFVEGFMVLFNGDLEAMRRQYVLDFQADGDGWTLELAPRSSRVRALIASIVLTGRGGPIERMVLLEADGDRTVTTFEETELDRRFAPTELRELFGGQTSCGSL